MTLAQVHCLPDVITVARAIAEAVGAELVPAQIRWFDDREFKLELGGPARGRLCLVPALLHGDRSLSPQDRFMQLLFLVATLRDHGASRVHLLLPYLAYARKDRRTQPLDGLSLRYAAQLIEAAGADSLSTLEAHNLAAFDNAFRIPARSVAGHEWLASAVLDRLPLSRERGALVVASPDAGGIKRAQIWREVLAKRLEASASAAPAASPAEPIGFATLIKRRSLGQVSGQEFVCGEVRGCIVLLIDDLVVSGTTLARAADALYAAGASLVSAVVTHDLREQGALARLDEAGMTQLFASDSLPEPEDRAVMPLRIELHRLSCWSVLVELAQGELQAGR